MGRAELDTHSEPPAGRWVAPLTVVAIPLLVAAIYGRALFAPFFFDDANTVLLNPTIQVPSSVWIMVAGTRPLLNLSFVGTFRLSGRSPWGHRLFNIVLHAVNTLLVYAWLRMTLTSTGARGSVRHWLPWIAATFFAVHPLQVEAVTYISGRADVLVTCFILVALIALTASHRWRGRALPTAILGALTVLAALAAAASKESGVVVPILLCAQGVLLYGGLGPAMRAHPVMSVLLVSPWLLVGVMLLRYPDYAHTAGLAFGRSEYGISPLHYFYTEGGVIVRYLRLALLPYGQVFDYDWPVVTSLGGALVPYGFLAVCLAAVFLMRKRSWLYPLAGLWILVTLAPTSTFVPIADVIAERRMYVPLVGVAILVGQAVIDAGAALQRRQLRPVWIGIGTAVMLLLFAGLAWTRNGVWNDPLSLWQDTVSKQPNNPRAHTNLGIRYLERGKVENARVELETALDLVADDESSHAIPRHGAFAATHLALAYLELGDPTAATEAYAVARELGAETYHELTEPLQRITRALANVGQGDPDAR
jgi:hypothetical protein